MRDHAIGHPALTDRPTGLANRLHFELVYSYLFQAADRGVAMTVLLLSFGSEEFADARLDADLGSGRALGPMADSSFSCSAPTSRAA